MNTEFKTVINDNLFDYQTISKLIDKGNPDLDNIKYICDSGIKHIEKFIDKVNQEESQSTVSNNPATNDKKLSINDIKTYEDILSILGNNAEPTPYSNPLTNKQKYFNAHVMLTNIVEAFNEGWIPNWDNSNERKYYPWFYLDSKGGGFRLGGVGYPDSYSPVTARLCFRSEELAKLSIDLFMDIYKEYFVIS